MSGAVKVGGYYLGLILLIGLGVPLALKLSLGFDVRDVRWWQWLLEYYWARQTLPRPALVIFGTWLVVGD